MSIRTLIRLKVEIQDDFRSYRLDAGVQVLIICLIVAVLVLSLVIPVEKHVLSIAVAHALGFAQVTVFALGLASTLVWAWAAQYEKRIASILPNGISRLWVLSRLNRAVTQAGENLDYVAYAMERAETLRFSTPGNAAWAKLDGEKEITTLRAGLDRLSVLVDGLKGRVDALKVVAGNG